jgi:hypothetical protein
MLSESIKLVVSGALLAVESRAAPERCCATFCAASRDAAAALPLRCNHRPRRPTPCPPPAEPGPLSTAARTRARGQAERPPNGSIVDAARLQTPRARGLPEPAPPPAPRARSRLTRRGWQLLYTVCNNLAFRNILGSDPHTYAVLLTPPSSPPPSRTNWTRLVPPPVLIGHVSYMPAPRTATGATSTGAAQHARRLDRRALRPPPPRPHHPS